MCRAVSGNDFMAHSLCAGQFWLVAVLGRSLLATAVALGQAQSHEATKGNWCVDEKRTANFLVSDRTRAEGAVFDGAGAPFIDKDIRVTVRDPKTDSVIVSVPLDAKGNFDLGEMAEGEYRLQVCLSGHGCFYLLTDPEKLKDLSCSQMTQCHLDVFIAYKRITDFPIATCPKNKGVTK